MVDFYGKCWQIYHTWILWVLVIKKKHRGKTTLPETNMAAENGWLEFGILVSFWVPAYFQVLCLFSFRECNLRFEQG